MEQEVFREGIRMVWGMSLMALASFLMYQTVRCLVQVKKKWWSLPLLLFGSWMLISMIIYIGDIVNLPPTLFIFVACVYASAEGSALKRITVGLMLASAVLAFNGLHDNVLIAVIYERCDGVWVGFENALLRTLFVFVFYLLIRRRTPSADFELSKPLWRLLLLLTLPPLGIVLSLILFRSPYSSDMGTMLADAVLFTIAILSFAGLFRAMFVLERQQKLEQENALARYNQKYYETMEQQQFEIRRLKHDLANHLQALLALTDEKRTAYLEELIDNPAFARVIQYSKDATVNAVLTAKESRMRGLGISFHANVQIAEELPYEKADICALFANALDNAIEACEIWMKETGQKPEIMLTARAAKGLLAVRVKNPLCTSGGYTGEMRQADHLPHTTKQDAANHGFGLKSMREVVKKYGGNMEIRRENGEFDLFLYMPLLPYHTDSKQHHDGEYHRDEQTGF